MIVKTFFDDVFHFSFKHFLCRRRRCTNAMFRRTRSHNSHITELSNAVIVPKPKKKITEHLFHLSNGVIDNNRLQADVI